MPKANIKTALDEIAAARVWLDMTENFPELLREGDLTEQVAGVRKAFRHLLEFRNLVRYVSDMEQSVRVAAVEYCDL